MNSVKKIMISAADFYLKTGQNKKNEKKWEIHQWKLPTSFWCTVVECIFRAPGLPIETIKT